MLHGVFYWILNMSVTASLSGAVVLLLRRLRWIPRRVSVHFWWIPCLRMVIPVGLTSPWSLISLLAKITAKAVYPPGWKDHFTALNYMQAAESYFPIQYRAEALETVFRVASVLWLIPALGILGLLGICYGSSMREVRRARPLEKGLFAAEGTGAPGVYGILRPRILVPGGAEPEELSLILLHEQTHIRRCDNLWRLLGITVSAIHWFNPLGWVFLRCFLEDLELSCDELVLSRLGPDRRKDYARFLLTCKARTPAFASGFGGAKLRTRIENILSFRKLTWVSLVAFLALTAVVFCVLLTNGM